MATDAAFAERAARLRERFDAPEPTTWRPDDDDSLHPQMLIGELVSVQSGTTSFGERQIAIVRDTEGTLWSVWLLHHVLIGEFVRQQPKIGELLGIRYDGRVEGGAGGSGYEKYRLMIDRPGQAVVWKDADGKPTFSEPPAPATVAAPAPAPAAAEPVQARLTDPPAPEPNLCERCGYANGKHADGCPEDIPF